MNDENVKIKADIEVKEVSVKDNTIAVDYEVSERISKYFDLDNKFKAEYLNGIEDVPEEVSIIPFVTNVLPILWLSNSKMHIKKLDKNFADCIENIRRAFQTMYPNALFKGKVIVDEVVESKENKEQGRQSVFFSGGVDSVSSLVSVIENKPILFTIWGTDVWDHNTEGWESLKEVSKEYSKRLGLDNLYVKTNFRKFIYEHKLTEGLLKDKIDDSWWRGIQHGIGLLGHVAPYAYKYNITTHYIPATLNYKTKEATCGSYPTIDESVKFVNCNVVHEGYDKTRLEKVGHIANYMKDKEEKLKLRVCYMDKGSKLNCCECEKCYLTIMEIIANKEDPNKWGFVVDKELLRKIERHMKLHSNPSPINKEIWMDIKEKFMEDKEFWKPYKELKWIFTYNPYSQYCLYKKWTSFKKVAIKCKKKAKKLLKKINKKVKKIVKNKNKK